MDKFPFGDDKLELVEEKFALTSEYINCIPTILPEPPSSCVDIRHSLNLPEMEHEDNTLKIKELLNVLQDVKLEFPSLKKDVKDEPEEHIYDDSYGLCEDLHDMPYNHCELTNSTTSDHGASHPKNSSQNESCVAQSSDIAPIIKTENETTTSPKEQPTKRWQNGNKLNNDLPNRRRNSFAVEKIIQQTNPLSRSVEETNQCLPATKRLKRKCNADKGPKAGGFLWSCCNQIFETFSVFNKHKVQEHKIEENRCSVCTNRSFTTLGEIEKHYLDDHCNGNTTRFRCLPCNLVFGVQTSFFEHREKCSDVQTTDKNTSFSLWCCGETFGYFENFVSHKFNKHKIDNVTCGLCFYKSKNVEQLRWHYQKIHFEKLDLQLEKSGEMEERPEVNLPATIQEDDINNRNGESSSDTDDGVRTKRLACTAMEDGILCQCSDCTNVIATIYHNSNPDAVDKPYACKPCNLRFQFKSRLKRHLRTHEGLKPFPCNVCGSAFTTKLSMEKHKLYKHLSKPCKETCSTCGKDFIGRSSLNKHIKTVHLRLVTRIRIKCEHCGKTFSDKKGLLRHSRHFHIRDQQFICAHCDRLFFDKSILVTHIQKCHLPQEKCICQICGLVLEGKFSLNNHMNSKHSGVKFNCEVCGHIFSSKHKLIVHMASHSDEKPFICQTCGKGFKRDCNLTQHQYTHSEVRPHACEICGQTFRLRTHVKQHMAVHEPSKHHKCYVCNKTFRRKQVLNEHLLQHDM